MHAMAAEHRLFRCRTAGCTQPAVLHATSSIQLKKLLRRAGDWDDALSQICAGLLHTPPCGPPGHVVDDRVGTVTGTHAWCVYLTAQRAHEELRLRRHRVGAFGPASADGAMRRPRITRTHGQRRVLTCRMPVAYSAAPPAPERPAATDADFW